jgi:hypothetical protein
MSYSPSDKGQWVQTILPAKNTYTHKKEETALSFEEEIPFDCF